MILNLLNYQTHWEASCKEVCDNTISLF